MIWEDGEGSNKDLGYVGSLGVGGHLYPLLNCLDDGLSHCIGELVLLL